MKKRLLKYFFVVLILFLWAPLCFAVNPWSGYWWPLSEGELIFGYNSDVPPLQKYDQVAYGYYPGPATYESYNNELNYSSGAGSWFGLCNGWSAAAIMTNEPTSPNTVQGVTFNVGDCKGLLSEAWYNTSGDGLWWGSRYDGNAGDDLQDLYPDELWGILFDYVGQGTPIVFDLSADEQVWNYPIYDYDISCTDVGGGWYDCSMYIEGADDGVHPDFVGIQKITRNYTFMVQASDGYIINGTGYWTGGSKQNHPDFAWYPGSQPALRNSSLNYSTIQSICKGGGGGKTGPVPRILANGYSGSITVDYMDPVSITISLDAGNWAGQTADWWVVLGGSWDWCSYVYNYGWAWDGVYPMIQYPLFSFSGYEVFNFYGLDAGTWRFYFAVDNNADGRPDATWYDYVDVNATGIIYNEDD
jgi:hypothetical protein